MLGRKRFFTILLLLVFVISNALPVLAAEENMNIGNMWFLPGQEVVKDQFNGPENLKSWPVVATMGSGKAMKDWVPFPDALGGMKITGLDSNPLPGINEPVANGIVSNLFTTKLDGVYDIEAKFNLGEDPNLGAFQFLVWFLKEGQSYQAAFHFRVADWAGMPFPNNAGPGIYLYNYSDFPQMIAPFPFNELAGKKVVTIYGRLDTRTLTYTSIGIENLKWQATGIKFAAKPNPFAGTDKNGLVNLSVAGKVGATNVMGTFTNVSLVQVVDSVYLGPKIN